MYGRGLHYDSAPPKQFKHSKIVELDGIEMLYLYREDPTFGAHEKLRTKIVDDGVQMLAQKYETAQEGERILRQKLVGLKYSCLYTSKNADQIKSQIGQAAYAIRIISKDQFRKIAVQLYQMNKFEGTLQACQAYENYIDQNDNYASFNMVFAKVTDHFFIKSVLEEIISKQQKQNLLNNDEVLDSILYSYNEQPGIESQFFLNLFKDLDMRPSLQITPQLRNYICQSFSCVLVGYGNDIKAQKIMENSEWKHVLDKYGQKFKLITVLSLSDAAERNRLSKNGIELNIHLSNIYAFCRKRAIYDCKRAVSNWQFSNKIKQQNKRWIGNENLSKPQVLLIQLSESQYKYFSMSSEGKQKILRLEQIHFTKLQLLTSLVDYKMGCLSKSQEIYRSVKLQEKVQYPKSFFLSMISRKYVYYKIKTEISQLKPRIDAWIKVKQLDFLLQNQYLDTDSGLPKLKSLEEIENLNPLDANLNHEINNNSMFSASFSSNYIGREKILQKKLSQQSALEDSGFGDFDDEQTKVKSISLQLNKKISQPSTPFMKSIPTFPYFQEHYDKYQWLCTIFDVKVAVNQKNILFTGKTSQIQSVLKYIIKEMQYQMKQEFIQNSQKFEVKCKPGEIPDTMEMVKFLQNMNMRSVMKIINPKAIFQYQIKILQLALLSDNIEEKNVVVCSKKADYLINSYNKTMNHNMTQGIKCLNYDSFSKSLPKEQEIIVCKSLACAEAQKLGKISYRNNFIMYYEDNCILPMFMLKPNQENARDAQSRRARAEK